MAPSQRDDRASPAGGFIIPAQPVEANRPPSGAAWVHEIKHDGYRLIVRRDGDLVRLWTRNAVDYTARMPTIAAAAARLKLSSFTIDGEAVVIGADGLPGSMSCAARGRQGGLLYAFDLLEQDGEDLRERPFARAPQSAGGAVAAQSGWIVFNEHIEEEGAVVFAHACRLVAEGIVSKRIDAPIGRAVRGLGQGSQPGGIAVQRERSENWNNR